MSKAEILSNRGLSLQVCVPKGWTDEQVIDYAEKEVPCGTSTGWGIRRQGDKALAGADKRVICTDDPNKVHIALDA